MPYILICRRPGDVDLHATAPNVMSYWGTPHKFDDKEEARRIAQEWAAIFRSAFPERTYIIKKVEEEPRKIIRRAK